MPSSAKKTVPPISGITGNGAAGNGEFSRTIAPPPPLLNTREKYLLYNDLHTKKIFFPQPETDVFYAKKPNVPPVMYFPCGVAAPPKTILLQGVSHESV
ncbi:MAG: hypothetical protein LBC88_07215 [Spirochaetaceae bacterium]|nr:hypothetical protein [Spirochaetaceae bacterium]